MHLYLAGNNHLLCEARLTDADCTLLARFLDKNSFITSVDLRYNNITDEGAKILGNMLAVSRYDHKRKKKKKENREEMKNELWWRKYRG